jgi:hypothetical protein
MEKQENLTIVSIPPLPPRFSCSTSNETLYKEVKKVSIRLLNSVNQLPRRETVLIGILWSNEGDAYRLRIDVGCIMKNL